jgi:hypothetical protein
LCSSWFSNPFRPSHEVGFENHELPPPRRHPWAGDGDRSRFPAAEEEVALEQKSRSARTPAAPDFRHLHAQFATIKP